MIFPRCVATLLLFWAAWSIPSSAQPAYSGYRVALFEVKIMQQKNQRISLRCRLANTGRYAIGTKNIADALVVEFDTIGLPNLLRGHEAAIAATLRQQCPKLQPGEISEPVWLNIRLQSREQETAAEPGTCAELVFDTVLVEAWNARTMRLRYFLRNEGNAPARLFSKNTEPVIKVYFVSGTKLTRGAIPAGSTSIRKGRETLDGLLMPGEILEGTVEIDLSNRSQFSPNVALEFDPAQVVDECGRTGNVRVLRLRH